MVQHCFPKARWQVLVVTIVLVISLSTVRGADPFDLENYRGKVLVVDFWASWCVPCRRSFPWMSEMQSKYGDDGLVIIGVNMDAEAGAAEQFLTDYPAQFHIIYDPTGDLARQYDVIAMPSTYVFDRDGNRVARHLGFKVKQQDEYEALLLEALNQ